MAVHDEPFDVADLEPPRARTTLPVYLLAIPAAVQLIDRIADQLQISQLLTSLMLLWRQLTHALWQGWIDVLRGIVPLPAMSPTQMDVLSLGIILVFMNLTRAVRHKFSLFGASGRWTADLSAFQVFLATISMLVFTVIFVLPAVGDHVRAMLLIVLREPAGGEKLELLGYGAGRISLLLLPVVLCAFAIRADTLRMHGDVNGVREVERKRHDAMIERIERRDPALAAVLRSEAPRGAGTGIEWNWPFVCYAAVGLVLSTNEYVTLGGAVLYAPIAALLWGVGFSQLCRHSPLSLWAVVSVAVAIVIGDRVASLLAPILGAMADRLLTAAG